MHFKLSALTSVLALFAVASTASPLEARKALDVWNPRITSPNADTVWVVGTKVNVTWDTSDAPQRISSGSAVMLRNSTGPTPADLYLKKVNTFDLRDGTVEVTVPDVPPGTDYVVVLFGDSGNWSPEFEIAAAY
ncbi:hypothetical protein L218DRAFT_870148 [Marasmius fiardii PR-910]|nr:hypothetical protein L218DRAFT_870148 [Marasmius fiardii PR-910]